MTAEKSKRGGARKGAGRPSGKKYKCVTLTMSKEAAEILKGMADEKGLSISNFIIEHFSLPDYKNLPSKKELDELNKMPDEEVLPYGKE